MSTIAAIAVKDLRDQTNCPMIDCKKALVDAGGDFDEAKKLLRERLGNLDSAKPDSGTEGVIALITATENDNGNRASYIIVEIGSETDFTANNPDFVSSCQDIAKNLLEAERIIAGLRSTTGENIILRRHSVESFAGYQFSPNKDIFAQIDIGSYVHHNRKIASVVVFDGLVSEAGDSLSASSDRVYELTEEIVMLVTGKKPAKKDLEKVLAVSVGEKGLYDSDSEEE